jgi:hypothetical protein
MVSTLLSHALDTNSQPHLDLTSANLIGDGRHSHESAGAEPIDALYRDGLRKTRRQCRSSGMIHSVGGKDSANAYIAH